MKKLKNKIDNILYGKKHEDIAVRVSIVTIITNALLSVLKFLAGVVSNSGAMISDAVHTLSDVISTFIVIIGVKISNRASDEGHRYGHERIESIASILLSVLLFITGIGIGISGLEKVIDGNYDSLKVPGIMALIVAIISILIKEWMFWYTKSAAGKVNSGALMADAWHHRSDALSSIGAFIGILGSRMGFSVLDPIASIVISLFICKAAVDIFIDASNKLVDKSCDTETIEKMKKVALKQKGVLGIDDIKTRVFGPKIYVDIEIACNGEKSLNETHSTAEKVHKAIEKKFPGVKHCMVHVNPFIER